MCDEDRGARTRLAEQEDEPALTLDLTGSQPSTQDRIASAATTINVPKFERVELNSTNTISPERGIKSASM